MSGRVGVGRPARQAGGRGRGAHRVTLARRSRWSSALSTCPPRETTCPPREMWALGALQARFVELSLFQRRRCNPHIDAIHMQSTDLHRKSASLIRPAARGIALHHAEAPARGRGRGGPRAVVIPRACAADAAEVRGVGTAGGTGGSTAERRGRWRCH